LLFIPVALGCLGCSPPDGGRSSVALTTNAQEHVTLMCDAGLVDVVDLGTMEDKVLQLWATGITDETHSLPLPDRRVIVTESAFDGMDGIHGHPWRPDMTLIWNGCEDLAVPVREGVTPDGR